MWCMAVVVPYPGSLSQNVTRSFGEKNSEERPERISHDTVTDSRCICCNNTTERYLLVTMHRGCFVVEYGSHSSVDWVGTLYIT